MVYRERRTQVPGVVLWQRDAEAGAAARILPDACLDLIWDGVELVVAGPDTRARLHRSASRTWFTALRFSAGIGPAVLGVPAVELRDTSPRLDQLWPAARARELAERVAGDPEEALRPGWRAPSTRSTRWGRGSSRSPPRARPSRSWRTPSASASATCTGAASGCSATGPSTSSG
jgi:hypothetical protein